MNISYTKNGDYLLPNLILENKKQYNIGKYGLLRLNYIKKEKLGLYFDLLVNDKLNEYLHNIGTIVLEKVQKLIKELSEKENITEELKDSNQMLWISKMNNIKNIAEEIVLKDISMSDITDKEFEKIYLSFYNNVNYLNKYVILDVVAFYLANSYNRHCLSECNLINHINSAVDIFNCRCDISRLIPRIK